MIYFLTELTLAAEGEPYGQLQVDGRTSGCFLSRMVRPVYNVIFDEWYQAMEYKAVSTQERNTRGIGLINRPFESCL